MERPRLSIIDLLDDSALLGPRVRGETWSAWRVFLKSLFNLPLSPSELRAYRRFTARERPPQRAQEAWLVVGRRGGKTLVAAVIAVFVAVFRDYRPHLAPGERATFMLLAADRRQAGVAFGYILGFMAAVPMLKDLIVRQTAEALDLSNRVTIEVHTTNFRSTRGYTIAACICDEIAFWPTEESANPDTEILNAVRPGMTSVPGSLLVALSSPYARRGELWRTFRRCYGRDDDRLLVWQADTRSMNPLVSDEVVRHAYEQDPASAAAEYGAEFRRDVETFLALEAVEDVIELGRRELPRVSGRSYCAFVDPSGGSMDSMTLAVAH